MDIKNSFDITFSENLIQRLQKTKATVGQKFNSLTDKAQQTATQSTENAIDTFNNTIEKAKGSFEENLPQVSVQTVVNSSIADWFEQHPAFLGIIKSFNWAVSHPIVSVIIIVFSLAILWTIIKAIGRLIETASLSILKIPLILLGSLIKYCWLWLTKFGKLVTDKLKNKKTVNHNSELQLNENTAYQIISYNKRQRLEDISVRLSEIQKEQQELLQEAADIMAQKVHNSVN